MTIKSANITNRKMFMNVMLLSTATIQLLATGWKQ